MIDIYKVNAKLSAKIQKVNLFIWERRLAVKAPIPTMKEIKTAFQSDNLQLDLNVTLILEAARTLYTLHCRARHSLLTWGLKAEKDKKKYSLAKSFIFSKNK